MHAALLALWSVFFQAGSSLDLSWQPDLDLPVQPAAYDPSARPPRPPPRDEGDPRDEPLPVFYGEEIPSESPSLVYVLDFSGSMSHGSRLAAAKGEFRRSVSELPPVFRLNVVVYDCALLLWSTGAREATPENKAGAIQWVEGLYPAGGGTATGPAVALALAEKENLSVILLTDGDPNCGADFYAGHRSMIRDANTQGASITVFGIDAWGDYRGFCQDVAADSGGGYFDLVTIPPQAAEGDY